MQIAEKKHRLNLDCYRGHVIANFTLCIKDKKDIFTHNEIIRLFLDILRESLKKYDCKNWIYVFMPDHLHLILEGNSEKADLWKAIVLFKQKTGYWLSKNGYIVSWQKNFYDHVHRKDEDLKTHIRYILDNPVRGGLVSHWQEYKFKGSLDYNVEDILERQ
jgi:putative transposase